MAPYFEHLLVGAHQKQIPRRRRYITALADCQSMYRKDAPPNVATILIESYNL